MSSSICLSKDLNSLKHKTGPNDLIQIVSSKFVFSVLEHSASFHFSNNNYFGLIFFYPLKMLTILQTPFFNNKYIIYDKKYVIQLVINYIFNF